MDNLKEGAEPLICWLATLQLCRCCPVCGHMPTPKECSLYSAEVKAHGLLSLARSHPVKNMDSVNFESSQAFRKT